MTRWLEGLLLLWMACVVFGITFVITGVILILVWTVASGERLRSFKCVSAAIIIFGLLTAFIAAQVWNDMDRAATAVNREASALRTAVLLSAAFPGSTEAGVRESIREHIQEAATQEWPMMGRQSSTLTLVPPPLYRALEMIVALNPASPGQINAQREIASALENAMDARRQRNILSHSSVNAVKWPCLLAQAICMLLAIAVVHCDNRGASAIAAGIFAAGVALSVILIASHDRPFTGQISVKPGPLLEVVPE